MKKVFTFLTVFIISMGTILAQTVAFTGIQKTHIDLSSATVLEQLTINPTRTGKVIVRFDGQCISDPGDRIVLAASNTPNWGTNDGCVTVEAVDNDVNRNSFSHTRVYDVTPGNHTFYAVAHNYVETAGSGTASIYGSLTVEFIPESEYVVGFEGIQKTQVDLNTSTVLKTVDITTATEGTAIVHFDGMCISDPGDRIVLAASNTTNWTPNDGCVDVEAVDNDINTHPFSHTRVYDIPAGNHTFYAIGHNYVEIAGNGIASIYGSLTVEFIPRHHGIVGFIGVSKINVNLRGPVAVLGQININPTTAGTAVVHFDGRCISDPGDRIILAASNTTDYEVNDGHSSVEALNNNINHNSFSHTRVYNVTAGSHTFYALGHNYVETDGSGIASVYGSLTVKFFPESQVFVAEFDETTVYIYPNPANNKLFIESTIYQDTKADIVDMKGQVLKSIVLSDTKTQINIADLAIGMYFVRLTNHNKVSTQKFIKH